MYISSPIMTIILLTNISGSMDTWSLMEMISVDARTCRVLSATQERVIVEVNGQGYYRGDKTQTIVKIKKTSVHGSTGPEKILFSSCTIFMTKAENEEKELDLCSRDGKFTFKGLSWQTVARERFLGSDQENVEYETYARIDGRRCGVIGRKETEKERKTIRAPLLVGLRNGSVLVERVPVRLTCSKFLSREPEDSVRQVSWLVDGKLVFKDVSPLLEYGQVISHWNYVPYLGEKKVSCMAGEREKILMFLVREKELSEVTLQDAQLRVRKEAREEPLPIWVPWRGEGNYRKGEVKK